MRDTLLYFAWRVFLGHHELSQLKEKYVSRLNPAYSLSVSPVRYRTELKQICRIFQKRGSFQDRDVFFRWIPEFGERLKCLVLIDFYNPGHKRASVIGFSVCDIGDKAAKIFVSKGL